MNSNKCYKTKTMALVRVLLVLGLATAATVALPAAEESAVEKAMIEKAKGATDVAAARVYFKLRVEYFESMVKKYTKKARQASSKKGKLQARERKQYLKKARHYEERAAYYRKLLADLK